MSFSDHSSKSTSTAIYKAVVLGTDESDINSNDLKECLLPPSSPSSRCSGDDSIPKPACSAFLLLIAGSCFGVVAALLGLLWLVNGSTAAVLANHHEKSSFAIFLFALGWSSATAITAYAVFTMILHYFGDDSHAEDVDEQQENEPRAEYNFALGVFAGFCATCTVHDAAHGVPLTSLLLTAGIAAFWGLLMTVTVRKSFFTAATTKEQRKGTKLPMPAFMV